MNREKIDQLISKYYEGNTSLEEERLLRDFLNGESVPEDLQKHADAFRYYDEIKKADASGSDPFAKIDFEKDVAPFSVEREERVLTDEGNNISRWALRIAAGIALLLAGYAAGQLFDGDEYASTRQVAQLQEEVRQMKDVLMNYQNVSAGERLAAVSSSTQIAAGNNPSDREITDILIYTMNNDKSVNVRMAAAEALFRFSNESRVRQALVASLTRQEEPLMQITLIDMLVELKAKSAVQEMEKMLVDTETRDVVRNRLETGIAELRI